MLGVGNDVYRLVLAAHERETRIEPRRGGLPEQAGGEQNVARGVDEVDRDDAGAVFITKWQVKQERVKKTIEIRKNLIIYPLL